MTAADNEKGETMIYAVSIGLAVFAGMLALTDIVLVYRERRRRAADIKHLDRLIAHNIKRAEELAAKLNYVHVEIDEHVEGG